MTETGIELKGMAGMAIALLDPGSVQPNTFGGVRRISSKVWNSKWHTALNRSRLTFYGGG